MGRATAALMICLWSAAWLQACGDAPPEPLALLDAEGQSQPAPERGPALRGRATPPTQSSLAGSAGAAAGPRATVDAQARISVPEGATWATVKKALNVSAALRRKREKLGHYVAMLVSLPGVEGYVIVAGRPERRDVGLALTLRGPTGTSSTRGPSTRIDAIGTPWVATHGCDTELRWQASGWSLAIWKNALSDLKELGAATAHGLRVQADDSLPAAQVIAFLAAAHDAGFDAPLVQTSSRRMADDAVDNGLRWLAAHQLPGGGWSDELALAYCDGLRMQKVPFVGDPGDLEESGLTGLVLCAFLGAGYTNRGKHPFARVVSRGLRFLKNNQTPEGVFATDDKWPTAVGHGWGALALIEAYGMTGSPIFKGSAQRGLDALGPTWRKSGNDPLATVLTAMGLRSAQLINRDSVKRGKQPPLFLDKRLDKDLHADALSLGKRGSGLRTAAGLMSRILLGDEPADHPDIEAGAVRLVAALSSAGERADPAQTWLASLVAYLVGGEQAWVPMRKALVAHVLGREHKGGHACCLRGSWDPAPAPSMPGGRVASTALHALGLQLFYRYDSRLHRR